MQNTEKSTPTKITLLIRSNMTLILILILSYALLYIFNVLLARNLSTALYGDFSIIIYAINFVIPFSIIGAGTSLLYYLPLYHSQSNYGLFLGFIKWIKTIFFRSSVILVVFGFILAVVSFSFKKYIPAKFYELHPIVFSIWLVPLAALTLILSGMLQSLKRLYSSVIPSKIIYYALVSLLIICFSLFYKNINAYQVILSIGIAYMATIAVLGGIIVRSFPKYILKVKPIYKKKLWYKVSIKMTMNTIVYAGIYIIDLVMLEILGKHESDVGMLAAILVIIGLINMISLAIGVAVKPIISPLLHQNDFLKLQHLVNVMMYVKMTLALILYAVIVVFGKSILNFFQPSFVNAYGPLVIASTGMFIKIMGDIANNLLLYGNHPILSATIALIQIFIVILLDIILIPIYHIVGATWGLFFGFLISTLLNIYFANRRTGIRALIIC